MTAGMSGVDGLDDPGDKLILTAFYLAYHNENNRPLMEAAYRMFQSGRQASISRPPKYRAGWPPPLAEAAFE